MKIAAPDKDVIRKAPRITSIETMKDLQNWALLKDEANVARIPLAKRASIPDIAMPTLIGFSMGEFVYDPWFTGYSQGAFGVSDDGKRTAANVYNFSFWQYADVSYYFGGRLVTVPPTVWTNASHKNGLSCLGTLNLDVDYNEGLFNHDDVVNFLTANPSNPNDGKLYLNQAIIILKDIAKYYGFDGYLINLEDWRDPEPMYRDAMKQLLAALNTDGLQSIWYDSPFADKGRYANYLNDTQYDFFQAAGYFQSNYDWGPPFDVTPKLSWNTLTNRDPNDALQNRSRVFSGINTSLEDGTAPYTGTFFSKVSEIQSQSNPDNYYTGLNIFYPAWMMYDLRKDSNHKVTDELPPRKEFHQNDQAFWAGTTDLINFPNPGVNPIRPDQCLRYYLKYERTVIQSAPFTTTFNDGEGDFYNIQGATASTGPWNNLSDQSILPSWRFLFDKQVRKDNTTSIYHDDPTYVFTGGSSLYIHLEGDQTTIDLFRTNIKLTATNLFQLVVKVPAGGVNAKLKLWRNFDEPLYVSPSQGRPLPGGWELLDFPILPQYAGGEVVQVDLQLSVVANPAGGYVVGQFSFLDTAIRPPAPGKRPFPGNAQVLDWSPYNHSSHYRVYGVIDNKHYLLGIVYNSVYRAGYGDSPNRVEADHIFNSNLKGFNSYLVAEVQASGAAAPV
jgi:mannosyl-glycoprotein endo-beta-N-acetylglucosaminidase